MTQAMDNQTAPQDQDLAAQAVADLSDLARSLGLEHAASLADRQASSSFVEKIPIGFARRFGLLGLDGANGHLPVAFSDVRCWPQLQVLAKLLDRPVEPILAPREQILAAINAAYQRAGGAAHQLLEDLAGDAQAGQALANEDLLDLAAKAPVIKLVSLMIFEAVKRRASDLHVQPYEERLVIRMRIDGVLYDVYSPPKGLQDEIVSRIKVMGGMNIAERRLAQDGRATVQVGDRLVDLRIASLPTSFGERIVVRLLDKGLRQYRLAQLGMPEGVLENFRKLIHLDHGIILVTGPTGSGKTTTLYAALRELDTRRLNVLTLEDPIEYRLEGISQTQVSDKKGMTFAGGLRHVLRQDPDVIMVGEIRDPQTAHMAIQSALTGHLVFSTLHTNDAAGAVARMLDLGVEPYLLASSLLGVLAQRLVRRICPHCKQATEPDDAQRRLWGDQAAPAQLYSGAGCQQCLGSGYHERLGIFELLTVDEEIRELVLARAKASSIKSAGMREGMLTLRRDGLDKVAAGVTTLDEVGRVAGLESF